MSTLVFPQEKVRRGWKRERKGGEGAGRERERGDSTESDALQLSGTWIWFCKCSCRVYIFICQCRPDIQIVYFVIVDPSRAHTVRISLVVIVDQGFC